MKRVHVAVGVVEQDGQILLARRHQHQHQGNLWEFPGGKVEAGETVQQALQRELREELAIEIDLAQTSPLITVEHDYQDKAVCLEVFRITAFSGEPLGQQGQPLQWVSVTELPTLDFPAANRAIIAALVA